MEQRELNYLYQMKFKERIVLSQTVALLNQQHDRYFPRERGDGGDAHQEPELCCKPCPDLGTCSFWCFPNSVPIEAEKFTCALQKEKALSFFSSCVFSIQSPM